MTGGHFTVSQCHNQPLQRPDILQYEELCATADDTASQPAQPAGRVPPEKKPRPHAAACRCSYVGCVSHRAGASASWPPTASTAVSPSMSAAPSFNTSGTMFSARAAARHCATVAPRDGASVATHVSIMHALTLQRPMHLAYTDTCTVRATTHAVSQQSDTCTALTTTHAFVMRALAAVFAHAVAAHSTSAACFTNTAPPCYRASVPSTNT